MGPRLISAPFAIPMVVPFDEVIKDGKYIYAHVYHLISNINHTLIGNKIVEHSDVVEASPVGAAPTTS